MPAQKTSARAGTRLPPSQATRAKCNWWRGRAKREEVEQGDTIQAGPLRFPLPIFGSLHPGNKPAQAEAQWRRCSTIAPPKCCPESFRGCGVGTAPRNLALAEEDCHGMGIASSVRACCPRNARLSCSRQVYHQLKPCRHRVLSSRFQHHSHGYATHGRSLPPFPALPDRHRCSSLLVRCLGDGDLLLPQRGTDLATLQHLLRPAHSRHGSGSAHSEQFEKLFLARRIVAAAST